MGKIRVLVVDDSVVIRRLIVRALADNPKIEVVATAPDGRIALSKIPIYNPDLLTLDIEMPVMNGLETLAMVRKTYPSLPVIMFSALTAEEAQKTLDCLELGAQDYVTKNDMGSGDGALDFLRRTLIPRIELFCRGSKEMTLPDGSQAPARAVTARATSSSSKRIDILVIAASTGGPNALLRILPQFPIEFPVPILIVQHMPPVFTEHFARNLADKSSLPVEEGKMGLLIEPGRAWVAPGNYHLTVRMEGTMPRLHINQAPPENSCRPSADVLFRSAAEVYGPHTLGVVLTGMGQDGLRGCEDIAEAGGQIIVQDEATSVVWGMPGFVAQSGLADAIVPIDQIPLEIAKRVARWRTALPPIAVQPMSRTV
ncbi:MAG TPA: chemotaxis response regulator protein-glutamate methylesterase [Nitrospiria bacterium]|nr:chemotaxis response regulator protein-glutamate methylesterase [Nitrospiria bacterium]